MTAPCPRRLYDDYDRLASEFITVIALGGHCRATQDEIADLLRSTFPPSESPRSDGRPLPVAVIPHPPHREGVIQAVEAEI